MAEVREVLRDFERYMSNGADRWFTRHHADALPGPVAYFCAEYGLYESLGIYSGGLGVLAGDHMKTTSDMALPFVGVGLMYRRGYFHQTIDADGHQEHAYPDYDLTRLPVGRVQGRDGEPLTVERVKRAIGDAFADHDCFADEFIVSHGPQSAIGHHMGEGVIQVNEPIVIDIWPQDRESSCFADMTRSFVVGEPSDEVREWHRLCKEALDRSHAQVRAGASGRVINESVCELFQEHGYKTPLTKTPGEVIEDGFFHGLGHGVGLEVHEAPMLSRLETPPLVAGDVVTLEPGLYRRGYGGLRLEDLVVVTEDGGENLTDFPYDLQP
jgi:hypothetical protein